MGAAADLTLLQGGADEQDQPTGRVDEMPAILHEMADAQASAPSPRTILRTVEAWRSQLYWMSNGNDPFEELGYDK